MIPSWITYNPVIQHCFRYFCEQEMRYRFNTKNDETQNCSFRS